MSAACPLSPSCKAWPPWVRLFQTIPQVLDRIEIWETVTPWTLCSFFVHRSSNHSRIHAVADCIMLLKETTAVGKCLGRWYLSFSYDMNARTQRFPAEHCPDYNTASTGLSCSPRGLCADHCILRPAVLVILWLGCVAITHSDPCVVISHCLTGAIVTR